MLRYHVHQGSERWIPHWADDGGGVDETRRSGRFLSNPPRATNHRPIARPNDFFRALSAVVVPRVSCHMMHSLLQQPRICTVANQSPRVPADGMIDPLIQQARMLFATPGWHPLSTSAFGCIPGNEDVSSLHTAASLPHVALAFSLPPSPHDVRELSIGSQDQHSPKLKLACTKSQGRQISEIWHDLAAASSVSLQLNRLLR